MNNIKLKGIVPVLVSPMTSTGEPDIEGINKLVNSLIDAGVGGFWALGSTGEDINIGYKERLIFAKEFASATDNNIPLITGTGECNVDNILRFLDEIPSLNIAGIHVLYFDPKQSDKQMISEMIRLADNSEYPVWLYHNPKRGKPVSVNTIKELRDHNNIVGMKVGGYSLTEMTQALMLETDSFQVIGAGGGQFFTMLSLGASAHTSSDSCCWPEEFVNMYKLFNDGKLKEARELQFKLIKLNQSYPRTAFLDNGESSAEEKFILSLKDICQEYVSSAYRVLDKDERNGIKNALKNYGFSWA
jgi:dihydrodipicolinate synthase/N-acetylneuraminate lyase